MAKLSPQELERIKLEVRKVVENDFEEMAKEMEQTKVFPPRLWDLCREKGYFGMTIPEAYGGKGLSVQEWFPILEEISRGPGSIRMFLHNQNGLCWRILHDHGKEHLKEKWLPLMSEGRYFITFSLTEPDTGSGADIGTRAELRNGKFIINGKKHLISFTDLADAFYIVAVTDETRRKEGGISAFIVDRQTPGLTVETMPDSMGCDGAVHGVVKMENCEVPEEMLLGKLGDGLEIFFDALDLSRASIAVGCLGLAQRLLEMSVARAKKRVTFGRPIAQRQAIQQMLGDMATYIHALRLMLKDVAEKFDRREPIRKEAAMCKLFGIETVRMVSDLALEIFGGIGYFKGGPLERMYRDARALWLEEGTPTIQRSVISRFVVQEY